MGMITCYQIIKNFSNDEDADFIAYIRPESVPIIINELRVFD